jgi:hypothetical protein
MALDEAGVNQLLLATVKQTDPHPSLPIGLIERFFV